MKALVIGGTGGQVARALAALDGPDFGIDVRGRPNADLAAPSTLSAAIADAKPDVVINCGAYTAVDQAESEPDLARAINAEGPAALGAACTAAGIPVVHLSTDYVFDGSKTSPYVETDPTAPQSVYGATKLGGETGLAASGAKHVILRVSWVHAPEGKNFVRTMLRLAGSRERLGVVADQIGRPTYAPHLAIALRDIAARLVLDPEAPTGVFHLTGSGEPCSWRQFAETIFAASQVRGGPAAIADPIPASSYPTPANRPANSVLDCARITEAYGLILPTWKQGAEECVEAIRAGGWQLG
ncbi:MAG TPA: dTDP-4-dehydrorhamnose reductase [Hyphomonadaceae bacterium]|nr:dTDP-4-dehydrorhamnose reductase [Hyphomonadaceae bacterium]